MSGSAAAATNVQQQTVPAPRSAPTQEQRPRRRHDGFYWNVAACSWERCPGR